MSSQVFGLWHEATIASFSAIWYARNQFYHSDVFILLCRALVVLGRAIHEANSIINDHMHNSVSDLMILKKLGFALKPAKVPWILEVF